MERGEVIQEETAGEEAVYLFDLYEAECFVAQRLAERAGRELLPPEDMDRVIDRIQAGPGHHLRAPAALRRGAAARSQVMQLTGGPGTGKTTSLRGVLALFDHMGLGHRPGRPHRPGGQAAGGAVRPWRPTPSTACWRPSLIQAPASWYSPTTSPSP